MPRIQIFASPVVVCIPSLLIVRASYVKPITMAIARRHSLLKEAFVRYVQSVILMFSGPLFVHVCDAITAILEPIVRCRTQCLPFFALREFLAE
jgi:hypothetical protein